VPAAFVPRVSFFSCVPRRISYPGEKSRRAILFSCCLVYAQRSGMRNGFVMRRCTRAATDSGMRRVRYRRRPLPFERSMTSTPGSLSNRRRTVSALRLHTSPNCSGVKCLSMVASGGTGWRVSFIQSPAQKPVHPIFTGQTRSASIRFAVDAMGPTGRAGSQGRTFGSSPRCMAARSVPGETLAQAAAGFIRRYPFPFVGCSGFIGR
jgi:hypothetical protein